MTRFFLTLPEAIGLLFQAVENSIGGETFVMNMPSFYIKDLAQVLIDHYGDESTTIEEIGAREGEKIDEILISEHEAEKSYVFDKNYFVILPSIKINKNYSYIERRLKVNFKEFSSSHNLKDNDYLKRLLVLGGFLK